MMAGDTFLPHMLHLFILLPVLYAEIHYRFKFFFSYLKKREPEIIADIPHRLEPDKDLPVLLVIKDADRYPVRILNVTILNSGQEISSNILNADVQEPYRDLFLSIPRQLFSMGLHQLSVKISYCIGNKVRTCINDNYRGSSHAALPVHVSETPLPKIGLCYYGEPHCHTNYTSDQVEFAASLQANKTMAKAIGLDFFAATDHSYDLDDYPDDYLKNDPDLKKWKDFQTEVRNLNNKNDPFIIIPGEEVSVRNGKGKNIHCLIYNHSDFIPGSGDGAEKWFRRRSEKSLPEALNAVAGNAPAFAAHPFENPPLLQRIFVNRGFWSDSDCTEQWLQGLQLINGGKDTNIIYAIQNWIRLLLHGQRLSGLAGNDAHGNFARFRQIRFPFFSMREHYYHLFGKWRTGVYLQPGTEFTLQNLLRAIATGRCFMTNGPAVSFQVKANPDSPSLSSKRTIECSALSSKEFGMLRRIRVIKGIVGQDKETQVVDEILENSTENFQASYTFSHNAGSCYYRCEIYTVSGKMAFSNPVWL